MVIGYHADKTAVPAGYWGVILFFVLSGYLVTRSLCAEVDGTGRVGLGSFYARRALRLLPALIVFCLVMLAAGIHWSKVAPTLGFYSNYARIAGTDLGPLTHTWFLAVLGHFYLLVPLAVAAVPRRHRVLTVGLAALAAVAWRVAAIVVLSQGWVYNATDTNAAALLAGCWLATVRLPARGWAGWSIPVLLGTALLPVFGEEGAAFLWGDFAAIALAAAVIHYASGGRRWLGSRPLVWLGKLSYSLYLWHYVFVKSDLAVWAALPISIAAAAASRYLVELPAQRWLQPA
jgi:peptidoglycan/LPS O-acetylase OafA/YrhL